MPLLSVVMPVYNGERYLSEAIESILAQTCRDFELIIVDDGSTDASASIMDHAAKMDTRIRIIRRPNTGIVGALNDGIAVAQSELVARMDADDIAHPERFAKQLAFLDANPDFIAVGTSAEIIDSGGATVDHLNVPLFHNEILAELLKGNGGALTHPTAIFRISALRKIGGYDSAFCKAEDLDLYLRLSHRGQLANIPFRGLRYRHHIKSTNFKHRKAQINLIEKILRRERTIRELPLISVDQSGHSDLSPGLLHARWACSALVHGKRTTSIRHAIAGVCREPSRKECWRALKYVLTARRPK